MNSKYQLAQAKKATKWLSRINREWNYDSNNNCFYHEAYGNRQFPAVSFKHNGLTHIVPYSEPEEDPKGLAFYKYGNASGHSFVVDNRWKSLGDSYYGRKKAKYSKKRHYRYLERKKRGFYDTKEETQ